MRHQEVLTAWKRILMGRSPVLSIEITKECPLSCPGCYAFQPEHLDGVPLKSLSDFQGSALVDSVLDLVDREQPLLVYVVGGERGRGADRNPGTDAARHRTAAR